MTCVAPDDAAGIDAMLARASSPLAGEGATFVSESLAAGLDPRALVAIAAHETMLETYGPSQAINNAFGLGAGPRLRVRARRHRAGRPDARRALPARGPHDPRDHRVEVGADRRGQRPRRAQPQLDPRCRDLLRGPGRRSEPAGRRLGAGRRHDLRRLGAREAQGPRRPGAGARGPTRGGRLGRRRAGPRPRAPGRLRLPARAAGRGAGRVRRAAAWGLRGRRLPLRGDGGVGRGQPRRGIGRRHPARRDGRPSRRRASPSGSRPPAATASATARSPATPRASRTARSSSPGQPLGTSAGSLRIAWERGGARLDPFPILEATRPPAG